MDNEFVLIVVLIDHSLNSFFNEKPMGSAEMFYISGRGSGAR